MQAVEGDSRLATALAIARASRQAGAEASRRCSEAADAFFAEGCACEPAVVLGLKFVDVVPPKAKKALLEISSKCPAGPSPSSPSTMTKDDNGGISLAEALALLSSFLQGAPLPAQGGIAQNGGGAPLIGR